MYRFRVEIYYTDRKSSDTLEIVTVTRDTEVSHFDLGADILTMAKIWGMQVREVEGANAQESYQYVDHYVLRLSLNGITEPTRKLISDGLVGVPPGVGGLGHGTDGTRVREELLNAMKNRSGSHRTEQDRFVNAGMGTEQDMKEYAVWWRNRGLSDDLMEVIPGPMLLSTVRGSRGTLPVPMPILSGSLGAELKLRMERAYDQIDFTADKSLLNQLSALPQTLGGRPKWNVYSLRRGGAKLSRETMLDSGATEADINFHFGWFEEAMKGGKKRQVAYASTVPAERRMKVTKRF